MKRLLRQGQELKRLKASLRAGQVSSRKEEDEKGKESERSFETRQGVAGG